MRIPDRSSLDIRAEDIRSPADFRTLFVALWSAVIGIGAGFVAFLLYKMIGLITNLAFFGHFAFGLVSPRGNHLGLWIVLVPVAGALVIGFMIKYGSRRISGHGIPEAMEAVLLQRSRIEAKVAILKPVSAAIAIGTGGPFGAEGPIIQTGGALGSVVGQFLHTTAAERKVLLAAGAAAGMAATFNTPIAGVLLSIELLLFEFKSRSFIPLVIASTLATAVHFQLLGPGPMFEAGALAFDIPKGIPFYAIFGVVAGFGAVGLTRGLYWVEDQYEKLPVDRVWWPAIGAVVLGLIGYVAPRVLGVGYDTISDLLKGNLGLQVLVMVLVFKSLALLIYLASGTSGGLLAPTFTIGAALGALFAVTVDLLFPGLHLDPGSFALLGMASVFGAAARATFTLIIFAFEITRDYQAILPLMIATVVADGVALVYLRDSIMTEKLARRGVRVPTDVEVDILEQVCVEDVMDHEPTTVRADMRLAEFADRIAHGDRSLFPSEGMGIVDGDGRLVGVVTRGDILRAMEQGGVEERTVLDAGSTDPTVAHPRETVSEALFRMLRQDVGCLPVVEPSRPDRLVGWIARENVLRARLRRVEEEHLREPGWLPWRRRGGA